MSTPMDGQMDEASAGNTKKIAFMFCKKWCVTSPTPLRR
jgi:hypothetical protein